MKRFLLPLFLGLLVLVNFSNAKAQQASLPKLGSSPVKDVIKAMTLEEKVSLLVGKGFHLPGVGNGPVVGQTQDRVPGAAGTTNAIPRLGIPSIVVADGPAGVRIDSVRKDKPGKTYYATAWPVGTLLASSWDTVLVKRVGAAFGHEVKEYGIDVLLAPALNIHRNPLGGRNFEYFSEDPLVAGLMTASLVNGVEANGVGTSIKHFAANNQETNRNTVNTIVSERALREIYLRGFELAVKRSQPWTVMSSYNYINGTYTSESRDLLTTILRDEWGFQGLVMTDWFGGRDAAAQMKAGNDLLMPGTPKQANAIIEAVKAGRLPETVLDQNVERMLALILQTPSFKNYQYSDQPDLQKNARLSREAAAESIVLLKNNESVLPLSSTVRNIAVFGIAGYELIAGGTGSGDVNKAYKISLAQGLAKAGYTVDGDLNQTYTTYLQKQQASRPKKSFFEEFVNPSPPIPEFVADKQMVEQKAAETDVAILVIGRNAGEGRDRKLADDYALTSSEKTLLKSVADAFHAKGKKMVVVLNIGGVIDVVPWRDEADAILLAWQPGLEGGNALADLLSGKVNPSGKLATTFPAAYQDVPSANNFPGKEFPERVTDGMLGMKSIPGEVTYEEGIYTGYRYYNTFGLKPAYAFGFGLSYTSFDYRNLKISAATFNGQLTATVTVSNTGKVPGKEVVQLYLSAPGVKLAKPRAELKGFAKTKLLRPGQSETITFVLQAGDLASFDEQASAWVAEAGTYKVQIGSSSELIRLSAAFSLPADVVVEKVHKVLVPEVPIQEKKATAKNE